MIIGPGVRVMHANLAGITGLGERFRLRTEIIASNGLNHPNYETQGLDISNLAAAGVITAVQHRNANMDTSIPRYVRLATRIQWQLPAGGGDRPAAPPPATSAAPRPQRPPNRAAT
ncbi:MAG: hypothetical protein RMI94_13675 [Bryobacterales bacterium]|nr:hypothetical protein [Bryobacterales bacterium]